MSAQGKAVARAVNLRVHEDVRSLIDRAARARGKSRSDFMIDAARRAAEETLLDQALVLVDPEAFARFTSALDAPADNEGFRRLMAARKPWSA